LVKIKPDDEASVRFGNSGQEKLEVRHVIHESVVAQGKRERDY
jgi:hypothetical protein